jgi:hypothetical protein
VAYLVWESADATPDVNGKLVTNTGANFDFTGLTVTVTSPFFSSTCRLTHAHPVTASSVNLTFKIRLLKGTFYKPVITLAKSTFQTTEVNFFAQALPNPNDLGNIVILADPSASPSAQISGKTINAQDNSNLDGVTVKAFKTPDCKDITGAV